MGRALEELEKPAAKERMSEGGKAAGKGRPIGLGKIPYPIPMRTADKVGEAVGMSGRTYQKAKENRYQTSG